MTRQSQKTLERQKLSLPKGHNKLLLHSCCAPCSGEVMETLIESGIDFSIFFYNPNIHPVKEYLIRKEENIRFANKELRCALQPVERSIHCNDHWPWFSGLPEPDRIYRLS